VIFMIDHTGIGVRDVARSAAFYDAALGALGLRRVMQLPEGDAGDAVGYGADYPVFWIDNGKPGLRDRAAGYPPGYYTAFVLDPDGNNMEAVCRER
jgi:catechol 2,3-dioxygenase-like lactoylglutathione lyase family enzyme